MPENISNMSYTEKEFQDIYPALLDLVKKISYRWDPSISDESDPGVVLLKLNAIVADKLNYNIDKNILETFPVSVTQEVNARNLFEQLGYNMKWYQAATTNISMRWIGEEYGENYYITVPQFSMVSDIESTIVYTLLYPATIQMSKNVESISVEAIQGVCKDYSVNNETLIQISNLDSNNRLYFDDYNIAENGIFISNSINNNGTESPYDWSVWERVDNLYLETVSDISYKFKFGIDVKTNSCYIEFPENIDELIGNGIYIKYIVTDGVNGNVAANIIQQFYNDVIVTDPTSDTGDGTITLTEENIQLYNLSTSYNGADPETINNAYRNYQRVSGTFDTLITLRDYQNAIQRLDVVSNGFACDRTNDIQDSYYILTDNSGIAQKQLVIAETDDDQPKPMMTAFDLKLYLLQDSPYIIDSATYNQSFQLIDFQAPVVLTVKNALNNYQCISHDFINYAYNRPCFIKIKYTIGVKIIPKYQLSTLQISDVKANIILALYTQLNSKQIDFGQTITYDNIYDIIETADNRIKSISLDDIIYKAYVVYLTENGEVIEQEISLTDNDISTWNATNSLQDTFRKEIYAKSILSGNTQLLQPDTEFSYNITQNYQNIYNNVTSVTTNSTITPQQSEESTSILNYTLRNNEYLFFSAPNLIAQNTFGSNCKYQFKLNNNVTAGSDYELQTGESIILYYMLEDNSNYTYYYISSGSIINSTVQLNSTESVSEYIYTPSNTQVNSTDIIPTAYQSAVSEYLDNVLGISDSIILKAPNISNIGNQYKYYWITGNIQNNNCILFNEGETRYTLKQNEFFIYTNELGTSLVILGDGTVINRQLINTNAQYPSWQVPSLTASQQTSIINGLTDSIEWFKDTAINISLEETRYTQIAPGYTVSFDLNDATSIFNNSDNTINNIAKIMQSGIEVSYTNAEGTDQGKLEIIQSDNYNWSVNSRLDLNVSSTTAQQLLQGQSIEITYLNEDETEEIATLMGTAGDTYTSLYFMSSLPIMLTGGINVSTGIVESLIYGDLIYPNFYTFELSDITGTNIQVSLDDIQAQVYNNASLQINYNLPNGTYLLSIQLSGSDDNNITISATNNATLKPLFKDATASSSYTINSTASIIYNFILDTTNIDSAQTTYLEIQSSVAEESLYNVTVFTPFKFTKNLSDTSFNAILAELKSLDKDSLYNYAYIVNQENLINNPLKAESFLDTNHPYNQYSICQVETNNIANGISVFNGVR